MIYESDVHEALHYNCEIHGTVWGFRPYGGANENVLKSFLHPQLNTILAVYGILKKVLPIIKEDNTAIKKIHYLTDSLTSQYTNITIFVLVDHDTAFRIQMKHLFKQNLFKQMNL